MTKIRDSEALVTNKLDRLGYNTQDVMAAPKALAERRTVAIVLQVGNVDPTSPPRKMLAAVAEMWDE